VQTGLYSLAAVAVTISLMWVGFKMVFQSAHFKDLAHIFWGGIVIGSSTALAGMFLN
jgi:type IV secretion system protein VirB2